MTDDPVDPPSGNNRGAIVRLFGVILVILGALDTMLSWRGGFVVPLFPTALIAAGLLLCLIGAVRRRDRS